MSGPTPRATGIDGEPDLVISIGDCEFYAECGVCAKVLGMTRPDQSFDILAMAWERHVMAHECWEASRD